MKPSNMKPTIGEHIIDSKAQFAPYNNVWFIEHDLTTLEVENKWDLP